MKTLTILILALGSAAALLLAIGTGAERADADPPAPPAEMLMIHVLDKDGGTKDMIEVMFNPEEYTFTRSVPWQEQDRGPGRELPELKFTGVKPATLSVELLFDTSPSGEDVNAFVQPIHDLIVLDPKTRTPPPLRVTWGVGLDFECVLTSVETIYTIFRPDGTPVRAKVALKLVENLPGAKKRTKDG